MTEKNFKRGDRVKLSKKGAYALRSFSDSRAKTGTVVGFSRSHHPRIHWDGFSKNSISLLHPDFVEPA